MRSPLMLTLIFLIAMEAWDFPGWLVGVCWTFVLFLWFAFVCDVLNREGRNPFDLSDQKARERERRKY